MIDVDRAEGEDREAQATSMTKTLISEARNTKAKMEGEEKTLVTRLFN